MTRRVKRKLSHFGYAYLNGNYMVTTGGWNNNIIEKTALRANEPLISAFPDSIDLKITNRCMMACPWCHEESVSSGSWFDPTETFYKIKEGISPNVQIELAIGGGDVFSDSSILLEFLKLIDSQTEWRPRITINWRSLLSTYTKQQESDIIEILSYVDAIGLSIDSEDILSYTQLHPLIKSEFDWKDSKSISENTILGKLLRTDSVVFHVIAGLLQPETFKHLLSCHHDILILGYKNWGRGKTIKPKYMSEYRELVKELLQESSARGNLTRSYYNSFGFDNLALEQLDVKSCINPYEWKNLYMGNEGTHSMYIDAVKREFAISSTSPDRESWNDTNLLTFFKSHDGSNNQGKI